MRRFITISIVTIVLFTMVLSFSGCGTKSEVKSLISNFQKTCNSLDFDGMLDCINPSISDKIRTAADLLGKFTDTDSDAMFDKLASFLSKEKVGGKDFFSSINISVKDVETAENSADASGKITYKTGSKEVTRDITFKCVLKNDKWYISGFDFD